MADQQPPREPRRHHYVPRLLLKGFAFERKRGKFQTHVFDKKTDRTYLSSIEDVMVEGDFNALDGDSGRLSLEEHIGGYESAAAPIIERVIRDGSLGSLSKADRLELARFVGLQFIRGTGQRAMFADGAEQLAAELAKRGMEVGGELDIGPTDAKALGLLSVAQSLPEFASHMATKDMLLLQSASGTEFLLGDNPVTLHNDEPTGFWGNLGLACEGIQIYLPLSTQFCLALWCPSHRGRIEKELKPLRSLVGTLKAHALLSAVPLNLPSDKLQEADRALARLKGLEAAFSNGVALPSDPQNVVHLNALQVMHAERFVISATGAFDLPREMIAKDERYKVGRRMKVN